MEDTYTQTPNGVAEPEDIINQSGDAPDQSEWQVIHDAYAEVSRRDTSLEKRLQQSHVREGLLVGLCGLLVIGMVVVAGILGNVSRHPHVKVQLVQVTEEGRALPVGMPQELLEYTPQEGEWKDMIALWVRKMRTYWPLPKLARDEWKWVYYHTCADARKLVEQFEKTEKPFSPRRTQTTVQIKAINKTPAPLSFHVLWDETTTSDIQATVVTHWSGTFTVGRLQPPTQEALVQNRLGLCVSAFDMSQ